MSFTSNVNKKHDISDIELLNLGRCVQTHLTQKQVLSLVTKNIINRPRLEIIN